MENTISPIENATIHQTIKKLPSYLNVFIKIPKPSNNQTNKNRLK